jgi:hypothetical protein
MGHVSDRISERIPDEEHATAPDRPGFQYLSTLLLIITGQYLTFSNQPVLVLMARRASSLLKELISAAADFSLNVHRGRILLDLRHQGYLRRRLDLLAADVTVPGSFSSSHIGILLTYTKVQQ